MSNPTNPYADALDEAMIPILRAKSGLERLHIVDELFLFAREIVTLSERNAHPEWSEEQIDRAVSWRISHGVIPKPY